MTKSNAGVILALIGGLVWQTCSYAQVTRDNAVENLPWYEISLVIFKNRYTTNNSENWGQPEDLSLQFPNGLVELTDADTTNIENADLAATAFQSLATQDPEFARALKSISLSSNYIILTSKTWRQPALDSAAAIPVLIQAGKEYDGLYELEGSVILLVSRYLHFKTDLWLADYVQTVEPVIPWWQSETFNSEQQEPAVGGLNYGQSPGAETVTKYESIRTVVLQESRRMRSGELHFLDHPLFGVLVKVTSYKPPEAP